MVTGSFPQVTAVNDHTQITTLTSTSLMKKSEIRFDVWRRFHRSDRLDDWAFHGGQSGTGHSRRQVSRWDGSCEQSWCTCCLLAGLSTCGKMMAASLLCATVFLFLFLQVRDKQGKQTILHTAYLVLCFHSLCLLLFVFFLSKTVKQHHRERGREIKLPLYAGFLRERTALGVGLCSNCLWISNSPEPSCEI